MKYIRDLYLRSNIFPYYIVRGAMDTYSSSNEILICNFTYNIVLINGILKIRHLHKNKLYHMSIERF